MPRDLDSFAAEWFRNQRALADAVTSEQTRQERLAELHRERNASDEMMDISRDDPAQAWQLILALVERAADDGDLSRIAAGPLEDLIRDYGAFADRIAAEASGNARLRSALNGVWGWDQFSEYARVRLMPLLAPDSRDSWESGSAARAARSGSNRRWRPSQSKPKSERFT
jgi:hypothetical protein